MFINILKTLFMLLGSRQNLLRTEQIKLYIENHVILGTEQQKLLGVIIDKNLSWDKQIDAVCLNVTCRITLLKKGERTGLVVEASDSGSGDPGSILGRVGVLFP